MKNKTMIGLFALLIVSVVAFAGITYAYRGDPNVQGPNYNADVHEQLEAAMDEGDYNAWIQIREENNLPMRGSMFQVINEDNFDRYVAMHEANLAGDYETAAAIRAELGLGQGMMKRGAGNGAGAGQGLRQGQGSGMHNSGSQGTHTCGCQNQ